LDDVSKIVDFIEKRYPKNPGYLKRGDGDNLKDIIERVSLYPLTNKEATGRLKIFIRKMLPQFGRYEDAFQPGVSFGFHSVLSSSLNNGLITPGEILEEIGDIKPSKKILPSLEGFIRQVFGWRSYCRLVYREERDVMMRSNYLSHNIKLPKNWFEYPSGEGSEGITKIGWLDSLLRDAHDKAYAHHIIRLMVFSNWFLLNQYHPRDVLDWFWSVVSIDAYEWVMVPNVLGMGQYADGGIMMMRPYISSSSYLLTMSRGVIKTGGKGPSGELKYSWEEIWGALFYEFLKRHKNSVGKMYAYARSMAYLRKVSPIKEREWKKIIKYYYSTIKGGKGSKLKDKKEDKKDEYSKGVEDKKEEK
jgi:deoxyribodipyrimidine photolyase-related protein